MTLIKKFIIGLFIITCIDGFAFYKIFTDDFMQYKDVNAIAYAKFTSKMKHDKMGYHIEYWLPQHKISVNRQVEEYKYNETLYGDRAILKFRDYDLENSNKTLWFSIFGIMSFSILLMCILIMIGGIIWWLINIFEYIVIKLKEDKKA